MMHHKEYLFMNPSQMFREVAGGFTFGKEALQSYFDEPIPSRSDGKEPEVVFFLPGLLAAGSMYRGVCRQLERLMKGRVRFHIPAIGTSLFNINCRPYWEAILCLEKEYEAMRPKAVTGHSWGGLLALSLHVMHPEVSPCAIGSPLWGTPNKFIKGAARWFLRLNQDSPPEDLAKFRARIVGVPQGTTTISSDEDSIAPRKQCHIEGARNERSQGGHVEIVCHPETYDHVVRHNRRATSPLRSIPTAALHGEVAV